MNPLNLTIRPEFFRLPARGVDPYFGLSRSFYYHLDATGQVLLVRILNRGAQRGIVLANYEATSKFLARAASRPAVGETDEPSQPPNPPTPAAGNVHRLVQAHPDETELMRKLAPVLLHDLLKTVVDLEQMVQAVPHIVAIPR